MINDNFLDIESFHKIQTKLLSEDIHWFYHNYTDNIYQDNNQFYFGHYFYELNRWTSPFAEILEPLLLLIKPVCIHSIRANLMARTNEIAESDFHSDLKEFIPDEDRLSQWTTAIFYINTNNGYTKLSDGTIVESKSNRLLTMSSNIEHLGTTCTDQKRRVVINLNYYL